MRIALVTPTKLPVTSGNSLLAERLRSGLAGCGHEAAVFSIASDSPGAAARFSPHVVHSFHAIKPAAWLGKLFASLAAPWVITLTGTDYNSPEEYGAEQAMLSRQFADASAIVVFHEEARQQVADRFAHVESKLRVIPQGIEVSRRDLDRRQVRQRYGVAPDEIVFFMAAGIRPVKNILFVLDVFAAVRSQVGRTRLVLAGPVVDEAEARRIRSRGSSVEGFSYAGEIEPAEVRELMAVADVYVNASQHEGMSGSILEAMAEGLPVLASDAPGNRALVRHGVTGYLEPCAQPHDFIAAAVRLASDRSLRVSMSAAAVSAAKRFSVDREIASHEELYRHIASFA